LFLLYAALGNCPGTSLCAHVSPQSARAMGIRSVLLPIKLLGHRSVAKQSIKLSCTVRPRSFGGGFVGAELRRLLVRYAGTALSPARWARFFGAECSAVLRVGGGLPALPRDSAGEDDCLYSPPSKSCCSWFSDAPLPLAI